MPVILIGVFRKSLELIIANNDEMFSIYGFKSFHVPLHMIMESRRK
ncbi:MAG: hypothetical protein AMDU4_FER2C00079G0003 [Ferroplasma sp. Type II]|nr:MAG: hypothetical protein AMDU4_FER2C00079G0003 [Ferroplasma sp. Type II]